MRSGPGPDLSGLRRVQARMKVLGKRFETGGAEVPDDAGRFVQVLDRARQGRDRVVSTERSDGTDSGGLLQETERFSGMHFSGDGDFDLEDLVGRKARQYGVDEALVRSVVRMESGGNPRAVSKAGARGLMQLMPGTAEMLGVEDSFDPEQNVDGGVRYLRDMLERYSGDETRALAAYHSGPGNVDRYGGVPPFPAVRHYVRCVTAMTRRQRQESS